MADASTTIPVAEGQLALSGAEPVLLVDPGSELLRSVLEALIEASPVVTTPGVETLREEVATRGESAVGGLNLPHPVADADLGTVRVAARESVLDEVLDGFHAASRAAALVEAEALSLATIEAREPSPLLITDATAAALVRTASVNAEADANADANAHGNAFAAVRETDAEKVSVVRDRYEKRTADAESYPLRMPSRRALFGAFAGRCDAETAAELLRLLDAVPEVNRGDPCDHLDCVYAAGARRGAVNYGLRRAAEDCGLASPSTLSSVKASLEAADLTESEPVPRRVGRPRQRVVAADARLANAAPDEVPEVVADAKAGGAGAENADGAEKGAASGVEPVAGDDA